MMPGYMGRLLAVNLSDGRAQATSLNPTDSRDYIGASGLAARLYFDRVLAGGSAPEPFDPANPLYVITGPLAGVSLPGSSRFCIASRSPLTGIWGEASCGGYFAPALKSAGYDGIVITGAAPRPVYLLIAGDRVELIPADDLWGQDTYTTSDRLRARHGETMRTLAIGPAGENRVRFAAVMNDKADTAGRTGMGAVFGAKNLKAIVAGGQQKVTVADPAALAALRRELLAQIKENMTLQTFRAFGTAGSVYYGSSMGDLPIKNWQEGTWEEEKILALDGTTMADTILTHTGTCHSCPVACKREIEVTETPFAVPKGPGPEYETVAALGSLCLNNDLAAVAKANELCNRYGMDTISCGSVIAFAIEATEARLLTSDLAWGDAAALIRTVEAIAYRRGIGDLLAEGVRRAAATLGPAAADMAIHVKGLEVPMHDPRAYHGIGLGYATGVRGACHNAGNVYIEIGSALYPEVGINDILPGQSSTGKAFYSARGQDMSALINAMSLCFFNSAAYSVTQMAQALTVVTGTAYTVEDVARTGERLWFLKRGIGCLLGATAADDVLPRRLQRALNDGPAAGSIPDLELLLREFYALRDLDASGRPGRERLVSLGLGDLADRLYG